MLYKYYESMCKILCVKILKIYFFKKRFYIRIFYIFDFIFYFNSELCKKYIVIIPRLSLYINFFFLLTPSCINLCRIKITGIWVRRIIMMMFMMMTMSFLNISFVIVITIAKWMTTIFPNC